MHVRLWIVFKALIAKAVQAKIDTNFRATFKVTVKICFLSSGHGIYPVMRALPHRILVQLNPPEDRYCYACLYIFHFHSMQSYISPALYLPREVLSLFASCFTLSLVVTNYRQLSSFRLLLLLLCGVVIFLYLKINEIQSCSQQLFTGISNSCICVSICNRYSSSDCWCRKRENRLKAVKYIFSSRTVICLFQHLGLFCFVRQVGIFPRKKTT